MTKLTVRKELRLTEIQSLNKFKANQGNNTFKQQNAFQ